MIKNNISLLLCLCALFVKAEDKFPSDSLSKYSLPEITIEASVKETHKLKNLPASITTLKAKVLDEKRIHSLRDIGTFVPNFYIPDYGSKMTSAIYVRGIGERVNGQSTGLFIDDIPCPNKAMFDLDMIGVDRIDILRGPQGTLYGRNTMSGIINIHTLSPFSQQKTRLNAEFGTYDQLRVSMGTSKLLTEKSGISIFGYYDRKGGYFTNQYNNQKVDDEENAGGRIKWEWRPNDQWKFQLHTAFHYSQQGAYPYGLSVNGKVQKVNYNDKSSFERYTGLLGLNSSYQSDQFLFNSITAYQYNNGNMHMDQDFSPLSIFSLQQKEKLHAISQEFNLRNRTYGNYHWSVGFHGFYNSLQSDVPCTFKKDGIQNILQPVFDQISKNNPRAPKMTITDKAFTIPGTFDTPVFGAALYHQSTFNNILINGLSLTGGLRFDYEHTAIDYDTDVKMKMSIQPPNMPFPIPMTAKSSLKGETSDDYFQLLPKLTLSYKCSGDGQVYATVAKGYKSGGYNLQMFSDLVQQEMMKNYAPKGTTNNQSIDDIYTYKPEYSWNYEVGIRGFILPNQMQIAASLFYINVKDMQLSKFVPSGMGRMVSNTGEVNSKGFELSLSGDFCSNWTYFANYGFTHATFANYATNEKQRDGSLKAVNYKDNFVPFAPQHTLQAGVSYLWKINKDKFLRSVLFSLDYSGAGKIYWTEDNHESEDFYHLLGGQITLNMKNLQLSFWSKNCTNSNYRTFYFESMGKGLAQLSKPLEAGVKVSWNL